MESQLEPVVEVDRYLFDPELHFSSNSRTAVRFRERPIDLSSTETSVAYIHS